MQNMLANWRSVGFSRNGYESVPERPGVYILLRVTRLMGLPMRSEAIYAGKSTNLRKRMGSYLNPAKAHNEHIAAVSDRSSIEFWCNLLSADQISTAEIALIRAVKPEANKTYNLKPRNV